jgi:SAM-dependent methyltransferase
MKPTAFDNYAAEYDARFTHSEIGKMQRARVHHFVATHLREKENVLEINCGTGEDALWLASRGHQVLATDASGEMLKAAVEKKQRKNAESLSLEQFSFDDLSTLGKKNFNFIFSNFGGLNCISPAEIKSLSPVFASLLEKNGKLGLVVMGRDCKWERFYFKRKKKSEKVDRRRSREGVPTLIGGTEMKTWYYAPQEIEQLFSEHFSLIENKPVGLFVPPSYLENYFRTKKLSLNFLFILEKLFGNIQAFSNYADHYLIVLKKK